MLLICFFWKHGTKCCWDTRSLDSKFTCQEPSAQSAMTVLGFVTWVRGARPGCFKAQVQVPRKFSSRAPQALNRGTLDNCKHPLWSLFMSHSAEEPSFLTQGPGLLDPDVTKSQAGSVFHGSLGLRTSSPSFSVIALCIS